MFPTKDFLTYYASWNLLGTAALTVVNALAAREMTKRRGRDYGMMRIAFTLFHITLIGNCMSVFTFWGFLWQHELTKFNDLFSTIFSALAHIIPLMINLTDFYVTQVALRESEVKNIAIFNAAYLVVNYYFTMRDGPIYAYMTWTDVSTYYILFGVIVLTATAFFVVSKLTEGRISHHLIKKREQHEEDKVN